MSKSGKYPRLKDKVWLEQKYVGERLSTVDIGSILGCSYSAVTSALKRFNIPRRNRGEARFKYTRREDRELLQSMYIEEKKSCQEIGECLGCNASGIYNALKRYGVPLRSRSEANKRTSKYPELSDKVYLENMYLNEWLNSREIAEEVGCSSTMVRIALKRNGIRMRSREESHMKCKELLDKGWLEKKYINEQLSSTKIGSILGCCPVSVLKGLAKHGIPCRTLSEAKKLDRKNQKPPVCRTKIELLLESILNKYIDCIEYTGDGSFWIQTPKTSLNPDFIMKDKKIAIEANGDYWHSPLLNRNIDKTSVVRYRRELLKKEGWKLIVFWESDINRVDAEEYVLHVLREGGIV